MTQKVEIIVEKFAQGITIRCKDANENATPTKALAVHGTECSVIGKEIWRDVNDLFNETIADKVRVRLEYEAL